MSSKELQADVAEGLKEIGEGKVMRFRSTKEALEWLRVGDELSSKVSEEVHRFKVIEKGSRYHDQLLQLLKTPPKRVEKPVDIFPEEMKRLEEPKTNN